MAEKNKKKYSDPVRYPKVIVPIENKMKADFGRAMKSMVVKITKEMVDIKK